MVNYTQITGDTLSTVLDALGAANVDKTRIVTIFHDGTDYVAIYITYTAYVESVEA